MGGVWNPHLACQSSPNSYLGGGADEGAITPSSARVETFLVFSLMEIFFGLFDVKILSTFSIIFEYEKAQFWPWIQISLFCVNIIFNDRDANGFIQVEGFSKNHIYD